MKYLKISVLTLATFGTGTSIYATAGENNPNIDRVLGELTRQHDSASSLVKSARSGSPLTMSSSLIQTTPTETQKNTDMLGQLSAVASNTVGKFKQSGVASWYGRQFHGKPTTSGETFDMNAMTAAHASLPMNCYIKVTNKDNGKSVVVKVNDRPSQSNRVLDLSYGAAKAIGLTQKGTGNVSIERVD